MIYLTALNVNDILSAVDPGSMERSGVCNPNLYRFDPNSATGYWVTRCARSRNAWEQMIQFVDFNYATEEEDIILTFDDLKKEAPDVVSSGDIKVFCSCPSFQFYYAYIVHQLDTSLSPEDRYPSIRNPDLSGVVCKHLISVFKKFLI